MTRRRIHPVLFLLYTVLISILLIVVVKTSWNATLPSLFNMPQIDYYQALCLYVLATLLFGNTNYQVITSAC